MADRALGWLRGVDDGRRTLSIRANMVWYSAPSFLAKGISFLLLPVYTRMLSPSEFGTAAVALAVGGILNLLIAPGIEGVYLRWAYRARALGEARELVAGTVVRIHLGCVVGAAALLLVLARPVSEVLMWGIPPWPFFYIVLGTVGLSSLAAPLKASWRTQHRADKVALVQIVHALIAAVAILIALLILRWGAISILLGDFVAGVLLLPLYLRAIREGIRTGFNASGFIVMLPIVLGVAGQTLATWVLSGLDRVLLNRLAGASEVGLYTAAYQIGAIIMLAAVVFNMEWKVLIFDLATGPTASRDVLRSLWTRSIGLFLIGGSLVSLLSGEIAARLLGAEYVSGGKIIPLVVLLGVLQVPVMFLNNASWAVQKVSQSTAASLAAAGVCLVANLVLIPRFGAAGAAWAGILAYTAHGVLLFVRRWNFFRITPGLAVLGAVFGTATWASVSVPSAMPVAVGAVALALLFVHRAWAFWKFLGEIDPALARRG